MKKPWLVVVALCLVMALVVSGCGVLDFEGYFRQLFGQPGRTAFSDMEYTRPNITELEASLDSCMQLIENGAGADVLVSQVLVFYGHYSSFYTNYLLSNIHYSIDMTDTYWETEYNYCIDKSATVDGAFDKLMYALADCPIREELEAEEYFGEGYFDRYEGESLWSETFTALMEQEAALQSRYYDLSSQALGLDPRSEEYYTRYGDRMAELFVELVALRQKIAKEAGYSSYLAFAYEFYHHRDFTPAQSAAYLDDIRRELVPLYENMDHTAILAQAMTSSSEAQTFGYVKDMANAMGGTVADGFQLLEEQELYHIAYGKNKYNASFEAYLFDYYEPFIFMNPTMSAYDKLTFAHEFGHFCSDYASSGSNAGVDVAEVFSQGMEYLSLCYGSGGKDLVAAKMADSLYTYVEQSAYASFEQQVYSLTGDDLTKENVQNLFRQVGTDYGFAGFGFDSRSYVTVPHFFTNPLYIISYVVSNDVAMQLYQMEQKTSGSGLKCYTDHLATSQNQFLAFVSEAGLESPFGEGRIQAVRQTFEAILIIPQKTGGPEILALPFLRQKFASNPTLCLQFKKKD